MIKRLIFDVDNTLITGFDFRKQAEDTLRDLDMYSLENLEKFVLGMNTYEQFYNFYDTEIYKEFLEKNMNCKLPDNFIEVFFYHLGEAITKRNEKLIKTISDLSNDYELVLLTNYFKKSQMNRLNKIGIGKYFIECYGEKAIKPNREAYISACGINKPEECVMIGDDIRLDIEEAQKYGLKTIFVNTKEMKNYKIKTLEVKKVEDIDESILRGI